MKKLVILLAILSIAGCSKNEIKHHLLHPNASSNKPMEAAIYVGAALIVGELSEPCSHGHPEDQIKCKKAQESKSKNKQ